LKLKCDEPLSNFAFDYNSRRYTKVKAAIDGVYGRDVAYVMTPCGGCPQEVTFHGVDADLPPMVANTSKLTGGIDNGTSFVFEVTTVLDYSEDYEVGRCMLTVSKPVLKASLVSAHETKI